MKILLVEDARAIANMLTARLSSFGHEILVAENGVVAIELFGRYAPDLVLMDIALPLMNGFEATSRIRALETKQAWAWTPIIFLTATATEDNLITAIEAGGDDLMSKNVSEAVLQAKMGAMSRIARLRQRLAVANSNLHVMANQDGLTGLLNRRALDQRLDATWAEAVQQGRPFALAMLDVDNFKKYNDEYGHLAGDDCLRGIANVVAGIVATSNTGDLRRDAFVGRYGGEEFLVAVPEGTERTLEALALMIVDSVRQCGIPHTGNTGWGIATLSVGGAWLPVAAGKLTNLFQTADQSLYHAKNNGRNRAELADSSPAHVD